MRLFLTASLLAAAGSIASAQDSAIALETERYLSCLERATSEAEAGFEDALAWRMEGGGWPAAHCEARALIALGDVANGAAMLDEQAAAEAAGREDVIRIAMRVEAGEAWLRNGRHVEAQASFAAALALAPNELAALLGQAEASLALGEWDAAVDAATASLLQAPDRAEPWRLRAAARLESGALDAAFQDMETARGLEPDNLEILVLRGRINEARRLAAAGG